MADAILDQVNVTNLFDLTGVVAVVTGGGSVRSDPSYLNVILNFGAGDRAHDQLDAHVQRRDCVHHWLQPS